MRRRTLCAASALAMMTPIPVSAFSFAEDEFDVVVAGAGGAGLAAALSAAEQGASVLLVEKMAAIGGNTLRASGLFNASDPARQEPMGITDSPSWHYEQTMASGHGRNDPAVVRRFVCEALPTLKWLESLGVRFMPETVATWGAEWPRGHKPTQPRGAGLHPDAFLGVHKAWRKDPHKMCHDEASNEERPSSKHRSRGSFLRKREGQDGLSCQKGRHSDGGRLCGES